MIRLAGTAAAAAATVGLLAVAPSAGAATITVNSTADHTSSSSVCTLRDAIEAANDDSAVHGCAAGHGTDTIHSSVNGTVQLGSALPDVSSPMSLALPGAADFEVTRDSGGNYGIFKVTVPARVTISGVTISNGRLDEYFAEGAGIRHTQGTLNLAGVVVKDNTVTDTESEQNPHALGAGIFNDTGAALNITDSTVKDNAASTTATNGQSAITDGGGLMNNGTLTIARSTFSGNSATATGEDYASASGGGIETTGSTQITASTIDSNSATAAATSPTTAIGNALTYGGAIYQQGGSLTMTLDTVAENTSSTTGMSPGAGVTRGGGVALFNGSAQFTGSTIANNTGTATGGSGPAVDGGNIDINTGNTISFADSIVSGGVGGVNNNCETENGTYTSTGFNLEDDADPTHNCHFTQATDISGIDPKLAALADNGGPTETMALQTGSPAIDAGDDENLSGDQRGYTRPRDIGAVANTFASDGSDIGAFEVQTNITHPAALDFGNVAVGHQSTKNLSYTNSTGSLVILAPVTIGGPGTGEFQITTDLCSSQALTPGQSCDVDVTFQPTATPPGTRSAFIAFSDPTASPWNAQISGTSFDGTAPKARITSAKVNAKKRKAAFKFTATDDVSSASQIKFSCSLDGKHAKKCRSPQTYKHLKPGRHTFAVTATDNAGNTSKPAKKKFKIPRQR